MSDIFKSHLKKFIEIDENEFQEVMGFVEIIKVKKKQNLLLEGQICKSHFFVLKGCLRKFFINEKGTEQTTEFAIETWWLTDHLAFEKQLPSEFYIQAVENSEVLVVHQPNQDKLLEQCPKLERYFRFVYQRAFAASQMRIKYLYSFSKEEFYHQLVQKYPAFVQRIPQYLIASFIGFMPEYLSEIMAKKLS